MTDRAATTDLAAFTTIRLGGPARTMVDATTTAELVEAVSMVDDTADALLVLGGGSNLVIADDGFDGTVVRVLSRGIEAVASSDGERTQLTVAAGEPWDDLVAHAVAHNLSGIECLSGIPGSSGATPIQNVGAYGAAVADVLTRVRVWDREARTIIDLTPEECGFGYRTSIFKHDDRRVVLEVEFALERSDLSAPVRYAELARRLDVEVGDRAPLAAVRDTVLALRRSKGMVIDAGDPNSVSAGSFFTNPILDRQAFRAFEQRVAERLGEDVHPPVWPEAAARMKTSAAWLIEHAGFQRGHGDGNVGLSSKHTLAVINRGGATTTELVSFARTIRDGVRDRFGVELHPEPTFLGVEL